MGLADRLDPHRLPDAGDWGVVDALGPPHLLASRLGAGVGGVRNGHDQFLLTVPEGSGDVERKRVVASLVLAHFLAVDEHRGLPIHRSEMKLNPTTIPASRQRE